MAAILLFGKDSSIMSVIPQFKTDAIYRVENLHRYDDRDVVITNLIDSYDILVNFGKKHLNDLFVLDGIQSVSARDRILREALFQIYWHIVIIQTDFRRSLLLRRIEFIQKNLSIRD